MSKESQQPMVVFGQYKCKCASFYLNLEKCSILYSIPCILPQYSGGQQKSMRMWWMLPYWPWWIKEYIIICNVQTGKHCKPEWKNWMMWCDMLLCCVNKPATSNALFTRELLVCIYAVFFLVWIYLKNIFRLSLYTNLRPESERE